MKVKNKFIAIASSLIGGVAAVVQMACLAAEGGDVPIPAIHTVNFHLGEYGSRSGGGELVQSVTNGCSAAAPTVAVNDANWLTFLGWSADFAVVVSNMDVNACYEITVPTNFDFTVESDLSTGSLRFRLNMTPSIPTNLVSFIRVRGTADNRIFPISVWEVLEVEYDDDGWLIPINGVRNCTIFKVDVFIGVFGEMWGGFGSDIIIRPPKELDDEVVIYPDELAEGCFYVAPGARVRIIYDVYSIFNNWGEGGMVYLYLHDLHRQQVDFLHSEYARGVYREFKFNAPCEEGSYALTLESENGLQFRRCVLNVASTSGNEKPITYADIWGGWSVEGLQTYDVPDVATTWDDIARILWRARDVYVKSGSKIEVPPSENRIVLSLGAISVPDGLMMSEFPIETESEHGVSVWRLRVFEYTNTCSLVAVAGKSAFELSSTPSYLAKAWVDAVYGRAPTWLDANETDAWYAKRLRSRIGWFVTLVPQSQWATYNVKRDAEVAGTTAGDEKLLALKGIKVDMDTGIHSVSVRSISAGETRLWGKDSLSETNWTYKGFSLQSPGTTAAGVHSVSNQMFVTATFSETTVDSDGDGIPDVVEERVYQTNPHKADTSGDGLSDWEKVYHYDLNPHVRDTTGDGVDDAEKILSGADPRLPISAEAREAVKVKIRYYYDDDDRLTDTWVGIGGASTATRLSPAGNPTDIREHSAR